MPRVVPGTTIVAALLATLLGAACASPGLPPGGPPDKEPPVLVSVSPESGSTNVRASSVLLRFDEVVNERSAPTGGGTPSNSVGSGSYASAGTAALGALILLSPSDGGERVSWRRTAIEIEPRGGFRPNTTYRVTLLPGLGDLRGNLLRQSHEVVFSTGATRPEGEIAGAVFDWAAGKVASLARVEVFTEQDTTLRWSARADSLGRYVVRDLAPGQYRLRGWLDANRNRVIDPRELFDSATVTLETRLDADLYAFAHDTIGPRVENVEPVDSTALRVRFDRGLDVDWTPDSAALVLARSDSTRVPLGALMPATRFDSLARAAAAARDSAAERDSTARRDTTARSDTTARRDTAARGDAAARRDTTARTAAAADTTVRPPLLGRPIPVQNWVAILGAPLEPGEYRLKAVGVRGLGGTSRDSERTFTVRAPKPPPEPKDSAAVVPPTRPPSP